MLKARLQKFIALLLLLAFTSQTMATAAMNCEQGKSPSSPTHAVTVAMSMSDMDMNDPAMTHMHHSVNETGHSHNTHQQFDCCKTMGHCLFGGCTLTAASNEITFLLRKLNTASQDFYSGSAPVPFISSLFRPPISC